MTSSSYALSSQQPISAPHALPIRPSPWLVGGRAFANGSMLGAVLLSGLLGLDANFGLNRLLEGALMALLGFAFVSAGEGIIILLWKLWGFLLPRLSLTGVAAWLNGIPPVIIGRILGTAVYMACDQLWPDSFFKSISLPLVGEIGILLLAATFTLAALGRMNGRSAPNRYGLVALALVADLAFLVWVFVPGFDGYLPQVQAAETAVLDTSLVNPSLSGPYAVQTFSYGSGANRHRPEFGPEADLITPSVDGSPIFAGYSGLGAQYFHWYWDFDFTQLPLNGLVWAPEGSGPFPLVLIVHGNHSMTEASDPGYAYLGEHLASQGYIAVSVDQNFLNGMMFIDGKMQELPLRAWMLLKHLQQWQSWNNTPGNPFYGRVDLQQVGLIGHSRGGEAVAQAAEMNWRTYPPVSAVSDTDEFGFGIRAVVSIAPSDGNYKPGGAPLNLTHSSYLLLAGGHDADTFTLYGLGQYNRVRFDNNTDGFKALVYLYQGNHGQFNTVWANQDRGRINSLLLNRAPLLNGEEQRQTAKLFITAFLEAALKGHDDYRSLFANPTAGQSWLPNGLIITQYQDRSFMPVDTNRPNSRPDRIDVVDGVATAEGMTTWNTLPLMLRNGETPQGNSVLRLAWEAGSQPIYTMELPETAVSPWHLTPQHALAFALATALDEPTPIQVTVELKTADGETVSLPLDPFGPLYPPLPAYLTKANWIAAMPNYQMQMDTPYERVLQTYTLSLDTFQVTNPAFHLEQIRTIRFVFDGSTAGAVYLDQVGFVLSETDKEVIP